MALENLKSVFSTDKFNSSLDDGVGRTGVPQFIGFTNDRGFVFPKAYLPYTGGLHGGLSHPDSHSDLDNINKETNQFIYNYTFYPPFAGGLHGADIWHSSPPVKQTPFIQISKMTAGFGLIGHPVDFFSTWQGTNSYYPPVQKIPGFTKEFNLGGYSFCYGDTGNSKFIGISSNTSFSTT